MHAIIMEMLKANPNERISSAKVVSRIKFFTIQKNNFIEPQLRIWRSFQLNGNQIPILKELRGYSSLQFDVTVEGDASLYDTFLQLISEFDATGIAEIFRLLLERRAAIPLLVPESKKHYLKLLSHVFLPRIANISLGDDKSLQRVAVISCRQMDQSQTCDILKSVFNIDSLHAIDLSNSNITSETMLAEIGCGCIVTEGSVIQNVLVAHVIGDFRPLWSFLRRFADCFMIEDSTVEAESFFSSFMTEEKKKEMDSEDASLGVATNKSMNCIWKPSLGRPNSKQNEVNGFSHLYIEDQLSGKSYKTIKSRIVKCLKMTSTQFNFAENRLGLWNIPLLLVEGYSSLECVSPTKVQQLMGKSVQNLENVKKNEFLLQKLFLQEAKYVEVKMENRLKEEIVRGEEEKIKVIREKRRKNARQVETNKLIQLILSFLDSQGPCTRVLSIRMLEQELANRRELELGPLIKKVQMLSTLYFDKLLKAADKKDLESAKEQLHGAKSNLIRSELNMEHLWRELSHLYTDTEPKERSPIIQKLPQLAAQHLLDGFCLELLDGDSNLIRQEWINEVLFQLGKLVKGKRVFVLSVMGVQSSGKSTLLNTMFGIRMRTSVGQCTRGVNMQLLAVEGRPEYDYILLLDTEGTRSPEYHGLAGSEKRDNQMATLSILLSDATIIVIPGENDAAVKEILPIVLMAYQGSQLAEENGGRLRTRIFFVYNRIDTKHKHKLDNIIHTLGSSLHEAFSQVQNMTGNSSNLKSESPFTNFNLTSTNSSPRSDVCILGNVNKQTKPPGDVPDEEYREGLIQFREHIHKRVTQGEGGIRWQSTLSVFRGYSNPLRRIFQLRIPLLRIGLE